MSKQIAVIIMASLASVGIADAATVTTAVTPPPAVAKALKNVTHRYCEMDANNQGVMQHRLTILGIKTQVRTGINWPLVLDYKETCEPTKADLHLYNQAQQPIVKAVRDRYSVPVWNLKQTYSFCVKLEKRKGVKTTGIIGTLELCPAIK